MAQYKAHPTELQALNAEYQAKRSSFVVLYGRRRTGKTTLIREFIKDKDAIYFLATRESEVQNRNAFRNLAADYLDSALLKTAEINSWEILFDELTKKKRKQKQIIVLDEFQYLGKANPAFPSIVQKIWDTRLKDKNVMVILCGSLISMMLDQTLNYDSPLYGRRTSQIKLKQVPFRYYSEFYPKLSARSLVEYYSVTGGIPKYIELFDQEKDIITAIKKQVLSTSGFLYDEPTFILSGEVQEIGSYFSLIKVIAAGSHKISEMASVLQLPQTGISKYLNTLIDLDILEREVPVTESNPAKSKMGQYKIKDNFFCFWFRYVYPYKNYLELGETAAAEKRIRQHLADNHTAYVYEDICREKTWELSGNGEWPCLFERIGRWWDRAGNEIDVVGVNEEEKTMLVGECKYWKEPVGINILHELEQKVPLVKWNREQRTIYYILFSISGFTLELKALAKKRNDLKLVSPY